MAGTFIISLDCEGKWGMADCINEHHNQFLTNENLIIAYRQLLILFEKYEVPATFAFVMAFTLSENERKQLSSKLTNVTVDGENWLRCYRAAEEAGSLDGWFCPEALDIIRAHEEHEIGCHGFCHAPLAETAISESDADAELKAAGEIASLKGLTLKTFVYPRNQIGYVHLLRRHKYEGYRDRLSALGGAFGRARSLLMEMKIVERAQEHGAVEDGLCRIPAGYFFNWRAGLRRRIPKAVTRQRWSSIMRSAAVSDRVAHLWFHPHNFIDGPETYDVLESVLQGAIALRAQGRLNIMTQESYVSHVARRSI